MGDQIQVKLRMLDESTAIEVIFGFGVVYE